MGVWSTISDAENCSSIDLDNSSKTSPNQGNFLTSSAQTISHSESENLKKISILPKISKLLKEAGKAISESDVLINDGDNLFKYKHQDGSICNIDLNIKHCSCTWYLDRAVCKH